MREAMREHRFYFFGFILLGIALLGISMAVGCTSNNTPSPTPSAITSVPPAASGLTPLAISTAPLISPSLNQTPSSTPKPAPSPTPPPVSYTVNVASSALTGNYLVDGRGIALYYTTSDKPGYSNLPDETLSSWPVFYVPNVVVPPSLSPSDFGTYIRDNKAKQTTYKGYPLYYFFQDKSAGNTFGNKLGESWFVVLIDSAGI
jgi:predicted lipoprotein with Yx(FWY)xxD motif